MTLPTLSVIIPVYNSAKYIRQCLDSVRDQTLQSLEAICIDDGSTDGSDSIILEYAEKDPRFKLVRQPNQGAGAARNNGITHAVGKYIHFLDSDDWIELFTYECIVNKLETSGCDSCIFQKYNYDNDTEEISYQIRAFDDNDHVTSFENNPSFFIHNAVVPWNKITRRDVIVNNDLRYDEIACANDRTFHFSLVRCCRSIMVCRDLLLYYRVNNIASTVGTNRSIHYDAHFVAYESTMSKYKNSPEEIRRMVADVCFVDFFIFFDKAALQFKEKIYGQLHDFFSKADLRFFHGEYSTYSWGKLMVYIRDHENCPPEWLEETKEAAPSIEYREEPFERTEKEVIVSLTSFPARIGIVSITIKSIMDQTCPPDRIMIWLADTQFPCLEADLPQDLLDLKEEGLEIRFCEDLKPHKKYFYAMQENPDSVVITIDDDVIYPEDAVECLLRSYSRFPHCVSGLRVHRMSFTEDGVGTYDSWRYNDDSFYRNPSMFAIATGVGGILYPPHSIPKDAFNKDAIIKTCLMGDDLWLKTNAVLNGYPTVLAALNRPLQYIDGSQESALWKANKGMGNNDAQLRSIDMFYNREDLIPTERIRRSYREHYIRYSVLVDCHKGVCLDDAISLRLSLDRDMEILYYDVREDDFSKMFSELSMRPSTKVLPLGERRMPLHAIAAISNGDLVVCIKASKIEGLKPEELESVSKQSLDVLSGNSNEDVFTPSRSVLDRRNLADSWLPALDDRLSKHILLKEPFVIAPSDIIPEHYSSTILRHMRHRYKGIISSRSELNGPAEYVAKALVEGIDASELDSECVFDDSPFVRTRHQCPICGSLVDTFAPTGARLRDNALCQRCGSLERHRGLFRLASLSDIGASSPRILCVNFPGSMNPIVKEFGIDTMNLSKPLQTDQKYNVVLYVAQIKSNPDVMSTITLLRNYISAGGKLIFTFNVQKDSHSILVTDAPYDIFEMCSLIRKMGFSARITWYREAFPSKSMDFSSLNVGEMALECTISNPVADEISTERAEEIAGWYLSKKDEKNLRAASSWYLVAGKKDKALDILWKIGTEPSCKKMIELCGDDSHSLYLIGKAKQEGLGTSKNLQEAIELFRESSDPASEKELCATLTYTRKPEDLKEALNMGDTSENPAVALYVAKMYKESKYVSANLQEYARLLRRSYSLGGKEAGTELLSAIQEGILPFNKDILETAERDEDPSVRIALSRLYSSGKRIPKDLDKAADLLGLSNDSETHGELLKVLWEQGDPSYYDLMISTASDLAEKGDGIAMNTLGRAYRYGKGVQKDLEISAYWMRRSESAKVKWAGIELVEVLWEIGTPDALREMVSTALRLSDRGDHRAEGYMGRAYRYGKGVQKDLDRAESMLRKSTSGGVEWASDELMEVLWEKGFYNEAVKMAHEKESASAMALLGRAYREGKGVDKDLEKAAGRFRKAGRNDELIEVLWNIDTADSLKELAGLADAEIKKGNAFAAECLGLMYLEGEMVIHDENKALDLLEKASYLGSESATEKLMVLSLESKNIGRAVIAASKLLDERNLLASEIVSESYEKGEGIPIDLNMSIIVKKNAQ
jgi:glycosyltransferase involved in cell wall biosynthesis/TPR repeat protein